MTTKTKKKSVPVASRAPGGMTFVSVSLPVDTTKKLDEHVGVTREKKYVFINRAICKLLIDERPC